LAALDGNTVLAVATGELSGNPPDSLWLLSFAGQAPAQVLAASEGFALGSVLYEEPRRRVFVADSTLPDPGYLRVLDLTAGGFTAGQTTRTGQVDKLPPRSLAFY
jgi:hypothetical protein